VQAVPGVTEICVFCSVFAALRPAQAKAVTLSPGAAPSVVDFPLPSDTRCPAAPPY
jgi:hypothetical protein